MRYKFSLCRRRQGSTAPKPHSRRSLRDLGLDADYLYNRFISLGSDCCPNCGYRDFDVHWTQHKKDRGWRWACPECGQEWREPRIMSYPEFGDLNEVDRPKYLEVTDPCLEESEFADGFIRKYK